MSEIRVDSIGNESNTGGPVLSGITTFSGQQYFIPPTGTTAERPSDCPPGSIRFNTDSAHLEYWQGSVWLEFEASSIELGGGNAGIGTTFSTAGTGTRGVVGGANPAPTFTNAIDYLSMSTLGNSQSFGELIDGRGFKGTAFSSSTRLVWAGGYTGTGKRNVMEYVTMASTGDAQDFGDQTAHGNDGRTSCIGLSNSTRGLMVAGQNSNSSPFFTDGISYVTIASKGDDIDFGDANNSGGGSSSGCGSAVRGIYQLGGNPRPIDYVQFATTGNAQDFGDLAANFGGPAGASNAVRGIFAGGNGANNINYITIATTGNAQDFGDLTLDRFELVGLGSPTRAVFAGGAQEPATPFISNRIDYVEIMTTGNAVQFGDLSYITGQGRHPEGGSNGHGGLS